MRINEINQFQPFAQGDGVVDPDMAVVIDGIGMSLAEWLEQFNYSRGIGQGVGWMPYTLHEITRDDLATEFGGFEFDAWDGIGEVVV
jgi:hypothetical protein